METTGEIFRLNLKRLRKARFPKQEEFAPLVNLSVRGYQKYETGETSPTPEVLDRFAKKLGCEPWQLLAPEKPIQPQSFHYAADFLSRFEGLPPDFRNLVLSMIFRDASYMRAVGPGFLAKSVSLLEELRVEVKVLRG